MLSPYLMHRSPSFWDQPDRFDPDRFATDRSAARPRYTYIPFSAGPRQCIGSAFAMMEAQLIVATIAQRYRLQSAPGHIVEPLVSSTLHPRQGVHMTLHPRQLSAA
jgi:cytochrome P450